MNNKRIFSILLLTFFLFLSINPSWANVQSENIRIFVDGKQISFPDQKPYVDQNNRTMVPVRFVSEALGAKVDWKADIEQVSVVDEVEVKLHIGQKEILVDGQKKQMDTEAVLTDQNRTMVPMRFISEGIRVVVDYQNIEGIGLIFNFTRDFPKEKQAEIMEKIVKETKKENGVEDVQEFEGREFKQKEELPTSEYLGYDIPFANDPGAKVAYITVDEMPIKVGNGTIYSLEVDENFVHVRQKSTSKSPIPMHIKEGGHLTRNRSFSSDKQSTEIFTYSYPLTLQGEIADGIGRAEKTKIEAFAFNGISNGKSETLVIENPAKGGN